MFSYGNQKKKKSIHQYILWTAYPHKGSGAYPSCCRVFFDSFNNQNNAQNAWTHCGRALSCKAWHKWIRVTICESKIRILRLILGLEHYGKKRIIPIILVEIEMTIAVIPQFSWLIGTGTPMVARWPGSHAQMHLFIIFIHEMCLGPVQPAMSKSRKHIWRGFSLFWFACKCLPA